MASAVTARSGRAEYYRVDSSLMTSIRCGHAHRAARSRGGNTYAYTVLSVTDVPCLRHASAFPEQACYTRA